MRLSHFDDKGAPRMVDVGDKEETGREAVAEGWVSMRPETLRVAAAGGAAKGDVFGTARLAGIMAAKRTSSLIPLCHPLALHSVEVDAEPDEAESAVRVRARVKTTGRTGVEMEALTAVSVACLTVYDMLKSADREMVIGGVRLIEKKGGRSGHYVRLDE